MHPVESAVPTVPTKQPGQDGHALPPSKDFVAYRVADEPYFKLIRAPFERKWMDDSRDRFAYRCLPLLIANQSGWLVLNNVPFRAAWNGGWDKACMAVEALDGVSKLPALTHFGEGVLTFHMPWLFRTPPGWNLMVRGPANIPKDGVQALEGVVETDWSISTFTMNWKFTAKNMWVTFEQDEPICMITPVRRGDLESLEPKERLIEEEPALHAYYAEWAARRQNFITDLHKPGSDAQAEKWERHYFKGLDSNGEPHPDHQTRLYLKEFERVQRKRP